MENDGNKRYLKFLEMEPCTALPRRAGDSNWAHSRSRASQFVGSAPQNQNAASIMGGQDKQQALDKLSPVPALQG